MDYQSTLKYLYESAPMFQQIGAQAYKPGLETTQQLDEYFNHPHQKFRTIHIAGTNGKGSCSHTIAAVLQSAGYKVGLYTSPHLVDFRERIRINGEMISESYVVQFVEKHRSFFEPLHPSFFELTTAMAFRYFADQQVEIAVIEVGMGGRLDCTNIITPELCVITNIGLDHTQYLGSTLSKIAKEKAGIIKEKTPVIIGHADGPVKREFVKKASQMNAPIIFAKEKYRPTVLCNYSAEDIKEIQHDMENLQREQPRITSYKGKRIIIPVFPPNQLLSTTLELEAINDLVTRKKDITFLQNEDFVLGIYLELSGEYQHENIVTIMAALKEFEKLGYHIPQKAYFSGFANVCKLTGLMGRWQQLQSHPTLICDTGHNVDGFKWLRKNLRFVHCLQSKKLHIVFGMVNDKDINGVLKLLPMDAIYYFTKANTERAFPEKELLKRAKQIDLHGKSYPTVVEAVEAAKKNCLPEDFIFVGGSSFIVADLLANRDALNLY